MKRFLWALSGIVAAVLIVLASSGASVFAEPALPNGAGHTSVSSATYYEGQNGSVWFTATSKIGEYLNGGAGVVAGMETRFSGVDINLGGTVPSSSYSTFTLQLHVTGYFDKQEFNGFVSNNSYEVVIVDQQIQERTSQYIVIQFTVYNYQPMQRLSLRSTDGKGLALTFQTSSTWLSANLTDLSWIRVTSGTWLESTLGSIKTGGDNINNKLQQILNNGIQATVDNSSVVSQLQQSQQQAHQDAQAQLEWDRQQAQKEDEQRQADENKANSTGDSSQSSADDSQSSVDSASASLFSVINGVKEVVLQGSDKGNCNISGNFGFFDAGIINLCTGGEKVKPITSVVGSIMLTFFTFASALTLINRFKELYAEYMGYK